MNSGKKHHVVPPLRKLLIYESSNLPLAAVSRSGSTDLYNTTVQ